MSIFSTGRRLIKRAKVIPIFLTITNDYAPYAACSVASIIKHADPERYYRIIILHDGLNFHNYYHLRRLVTRNCEIQFHRITHNIYLRAIIKSCSSKTGSGDFFSSAVYFYRLFIARLYPQYERAIYIDSDTVALDDIAELFDLDIGDDAVAALVDPKVSDIPEFRAYVENALGVPAKEYVNSGVLLMNLKKLRKIHFLSRMVKIIEEQDPSLVAPDQDYLNVICRGEIYHLDSCWNAQPIKSGAPKGAKILHFNLFKKPWQCDGVDGEEIFWKAAKVSGYKTELEKAKEKFSIKDLRIKEDQLQALLHKADKLSKAKEPIIKNVDL